MKFNTYLLGTAGLILIPACTGIQSGKKLPDIVFILADDLGYGDISFLNPESRIRTPNIDRIAQSGVVFTDAHSGSAVSTPTRYGILTGRYSWRSELKSGVLDGYSEALSNSRVWWMEFPPNGKGRGRIAGSSALRFGTGPFREGQSAG